MSVLPMRPSVASMTQDLGHNEWRPSRVERRLTQRHATAGTDFMEEEMRDNTPRLAGPGQVGLPQEQEQGR